MKESTGQETEGEGNGNEIYIVSEVDLIKAWEISDVDMRKPQEGEFKESKHSMLSVATQRGMNECREAWTKVAR